MKKGLIRIPLVPIIIFIICVAIIFFSINGIKNKEKNANEEISEKAVTFEVSDIVARKGEEVTITIKMLEDSNFIAANFELVFDNSKIQFVKYSKGEILENGAMSAVNSEGNSNKILIGYVGQPQNEENIVKKGELINVTFRVNESIQDLEIKPEFKCTTLKEKDGKDIANRIKQGKIIIE